MKLASINILDPKFRENPMAAYHELRAQGAVMCVMSPFHALMSLKHLDCNTLLKDPRVAIDDSYFDRLMRDVEVDEALLAYKDIRERWMLFQNSSRHKELRKPVAPTFKPDIVKTYAPIVRRETLKVLNQIKEKKEFDLVTEVAEVIASHINCAVIGIPGSHYERFAGITRIIAKGLDITDAVQDDVERFRKAGAAYLEFKELFQGFLKRGELRTDSPFAQMVRDQIQGGCPMSRSEDLLATASLMTLAGHHTIINSMSGSVNALLSDPEHAHLLKTPHTFSPLAVEELLRFTSVVNLTRRIITEPLPFYGKVIPKGTEIWLSLASANFDEDVFENSVKLNLERKPNPHLSFGTGMHSCIGLHLARLQIKTFLEELSALSLNLTIDPDKASPKHDNFILPGFKHLYMKVL